MADIEKKEFDGGEGFEAQRVRDIDELSEQGRIERTTTHRGLNARQISMIALGGAVGTGLIIGSGSALAKSGPVGLVIGYAWMGMICFFVMISLGEMATYLPNKAGFAGYASRFVDPALGFALGWNYLFKYLIVTPNNIVAACIVIQYWNQSVNPAVWCTIIIAAILLINLIGVKVFGEVEFWLSFFKVCTLIGLIIMGIVLDLGGGPNHTRLGFWYWVNPGPFSTYIYTGPVGTFLGFWFVMTNALFAYIGTELVGVTVGECQNPRKNVPAAIKRTFWRILVFYVGGVFVIGLLVPSNSEALIGANKSSSSAAASPFVVAIVLQGIGTLPSIINAAILLFVFSAANSDLYIGSRTLFALAIEGQAPAIFKKVNRYGIPHWSLGFCTLTTALSYTVASTSALVVFKYFVSLISLFGALTWMCISFSHIRFMGALKAQGISRDTLPYKAPFQPWGTWLAFTFTGIVAFFKGFDAFMPTFQYVPFITNYIGFPVFVALFVGYKILYKTRMIPLAEIDLHSGKREIDEDEEEFVQDHDAKPRNIFQKIWDGA